ncbi:MAG: c-type cytochrome [Limisphaerales bacterium]|nr:MAG: c-type cytochrome [Limisphaerales bacterium]|tara:strand:- start:4606 stop:5604 length:999 start_codon:yes stop_codon:yes gene_type:complete
MFLRVMVLALIGQLSLLEISADDSIKPWLTIFGKPLKTLELPKDKVALSLVELGRTLYHEKRLSRDNSISCNSCHDTKAFGVDGEKFSVGFNNHLTGRNSPTSFNAFMHVSQFWDGRAPTVEEQAKGPILAGGEMAMPSAEAVVKKINGIKGYKDLFEAAFPNSSPAITYDNVGKAIGAYERLFVTPSKFDKLLAGELSALNEKQKRGLKKFVTSGCVTCHTGNLLGGNIYQKLGLVKPWPNQKDQGRFAITKKEQDKMFFKVPSLRNIEKTGPYFHDGSSEKLSEAVEVMARHQLGREFSKEEISDIVAFLKTLTGKLNPSIAAYPEKFPD